MTRYLRRAAAACLWAHLYATALYFLPVAGLAVAVLSGATPLENWAAINAALAVAAIVLGWALSIRRTARVPTNPPREG